MTETNEEIQSEDEIVEPEEVAEGDEDLTDWKALALKNQGIAKRLKTKLEKQKEVKPEVKPEQPEKPSDYKFTTGDKALLKSYKDIQGIDELTLAENWMKKYGGEIDDMLSDEVFGSKLKALRDAKATKDAIPTSSGRSTGSTNNKIDYWLEKYQSSGNLADVPKDLQREVLNARLKAEEQKHKFG